MTEIGICSRHNDIRTSLLCARCGDPICPECMTVSPVGYRCPDCSKITKIPTYNISTKLLLKVLVVAIIAGILIGGTLFFFVLSLGLSSLPKYVNYYLFMALIAVSGFFMGEAVSLASNRKRGRPLKYVCSIGILILVCMLVAINVISIGTLINFNMLIALAIAFYLAFKRV